MDVIQSGIQQVGTSLAQVGCPCICTTGSSSMDSQGLDGGTCGCSCGCPGPSSDVDNARANSGSASGYIPQAV